MEQNNNVFTIQKEIMKLRTLSSTAKIVYMTLQSYAYDNIHCYPTLETISEDLGGLTRPTLVKAVQELKAFGLIKTTKYPLHNKTIYILLPLEWVGNLTVEGDIIPVPETEQEFDYKDLNNIITQIKQFYAGNLETPTISATSRPKKTPYQTMLEKLEQGDKNLTIKELIEYLKYIYEKNSDKKLIIPHRNNKAEKIITELRRELGEHITDFLEIVGKNFDKDFRYNKYNQLSISMFEWTNIKLHYLKMLENKLNFDEMMRKHQEDEDVVGITF